MDRAVGAIRYCHVGLADHEVQARVAAEVHRIGGLGQGLQPQLQAVADAELREAHAVTPRQGSERRIVQRRILRDGE